MWGRASLRAEREAPRPAAPVPAGRHRPPARRRDHQRGQGLRPGAQRPARCGHMCATSSPAQGSWWWHGTLPGAVQPARTAATWARGSRPVGTATRAACRAGTVAGRLDANIVAALQRKWERTFRYRAAEENRAAEASRRRKAGPVAGANVRLTPDAPAARLGPASKGRPSGGAGCWRGVKWPRGMPREAHGDPLPLVRGLPGARSGSSSPAGAAPTTAVAVGQANRAAEVRFQSVPEGGRALPPPAGAGDAARTP